MVAKKKKSAAPAKRKPAEDDSNTEQLHIPAQYEQRWNALVSTVRAARTALPPSTAVKATS